METKVKEFFKLKKPQMYEACVTPNCPRLLIYSVGSDIHMIECSKHQYKEMFFIPKLA